MAMRAGPRMAVGSAAWIAEEHSTALGMVKAEMEEFSFSVRNEADWLNEHMAEILSENRVNVAELFKTPRKLRGKTPWTERKANGGEARVPLSDVFSSTPRGAPSAIAKSLAQAQQARTPERQMSNDRPENANARAASPPQPAASAAPRPQPRPAAVHDSGHRGSQPSMMGMDTQQTLALATKKDTTAPWGTDGTVSATATMHTAGSAVDSMGDRLASATEEQTWQLPAMLATTTASPTATATDVAAKTTSSTAARPQAPTEAKESSSAKSSAGRKLSVRKGQRSCPPKKPVEVHGENGLDDNEGGSRSPSDGSSPIRPIVRKSSLNFASLPAREPLTSSKSLGTRLSRTSHVEQNCYGRHTGGQSLSTTCGKELGDKYNDDEIDLDEDLTCGNDPTVVAAPNRTYTQRLQDQISMLGKTPAHGPRPSKSLASLLPSQQAVGAQQTQPDYVQEPPSSTAPNSKQSMLAPGAFPDDDGDDWIAPTSKTLIAPSPRPGMRTSRSADLLPDLSGQIGTSTTGGSEVVLVHGRTASPSKFATHFGLSKSSVSVLYESSDTKVALANPGLARVSEDDTVPMTPKSPSSRSFRDSPLKQVKHKLSSILKSSKGLLASSAAISAEGKSSLLSPSTRLGLHLDSSVESFKTAENVTCDPLSHPAGQPVSPARSNGARRTRASIEREKREVKEKEKGAKHVHDQMEKLEKAREKEREKARIFSREQEKQADMERQLAARREQEKAAKVQAEARARARAETEARAQAEAQAEARAEAEAQAHTRAQTARTPASKATRSSPRKPKANAEAETRDVDMADAPTAIAPPSVSRPGTAHRSQTIRRTVKPTKEAASKSKEAPKVIRVNPTSSQYSQFQPSNSLLAATLQDTLGPAQGQSQRTVTNKTSQSSLQGKSSVMGPKSSVSSSSGRPKALDVAAKRKEQEEREAQRRREAKAGMERKRAALQGEERRQEQQRKAQTEKQKEEEHKAAQAKKDAARQAALEKAKQTRAPPPPVRSQPNGPPDHAASDKAPSRPQSRLGTTMTNQAVNAVLSSTVKATGKRPRQLDATEDRPATQRSALGQLKDAKKIRMSDDFGHGTDTADSGRNLKAPPVRPSVGFKKDLASKPILPNGYVAASQHGASRDIFKTSSINSQLPHVKTAHPLDMAHVSKAAIPFAPNTNPAAASSYNKTPARPGGLATAAIKSSAKAAARSSARFQNGEAIELPDISTDDEDDEYDSDEGGKDAKLVASWAESPALRSALVNQEKMDPMDIFGPPAPLKMEEVFRNKDRWHKFRARTSSANWSGSDRLTEDEIRRDLQARDKMRNEGGWSYELSKDMQ